MGRQLPQRESCVSCKGRAFSAGPSAARWLDIPEETAIEDILARRGMTISNGPAGINEHTLRLLRTFRYRYR